jgi:ABC-2 type transport system permease protein
MSAIVATGRPPTNVVQRIRFAMRDGMVVAYRNLVTLGRVPTVLVFELVQPIMFVLLFRFIYANQFNPEFLRGINYVLFLMPGIFVQNAIFGSTTTAIGVADDLKKGLIDRFRSLPMARSAVLVGRTTADLAKNLLLVLLVIGVGYLVGFRFEEGLLSALGVVVLVLAVSFTFSWISATVGLALKEVEAVQAAIFTVIFPIVFVSSAFVPVEGMASWLQPIAEHNPVTYWCNLARYLSIGPIAIPIDPATNQPIYTFEHLLLLSSAWIAGLLAVFIPLSIRMYRRLA